MNLDNLMQSSGEWLRGTGVDHDIVVSTRIRLARNLAAFPFSNRASAHQKAEIETMLRDRLMKLNFQPKLDYVSLAPLGTVDRQFLVERQLISRELASNDGPRGVVLSPTETISVMINEEDHLRLQVMRSGIARRVPRPSPRTSKDRGRDHDTRVAPSRGFPGRDAGQRR